MKLFTLVLLIYTTSVLAIEQSGEPKICKNQSTQKEIDISTCNLEEYGSEEVIEGLSEITIKAMCSDEAYINELETFKINTDFENHFVDFNREHLKFKCDCANLTGRDICEESSIKEDLKILKGSLGKDVNYKKLFNSFDDVDRLLSGLELNYVDVCGINISDQVKELCASESSRVEEELSQKCFGESSFYCKQLKGDDRVFVPRYSSIIRKLKSTLVKNNKKEQRKLRKIKTFQDIKDAVNIHFQTDLDSIKDEFFSRIRAGEEINEVLKSYSSDEEELDLLNYSNRDELDKGMWLKIALRMTEPFSRYAINGNKNKDEEIKSLLKKIAKYPNDSILEIYKRDILKEEIQPVCQDIKSQIRNSCRPENLSNESLKNDLKEISLNGIEFMLKNSITPEEQSKVAGAYSRSFCLLGNSQKLGNSESNLSSTNFTASLEGNIEIPNIVGISEVEDKSQNVIRVAKEAGSNKAKQNNALKKARKIKTPSGGTLKVDRFKDIPKAIARNLKEWKLKGNDMAISRVKKMKELYGQYRDILAGKRKATPKEMESLTSQISDISAELKELEARGLLEIDEDLEREIATTERIINKPKNINQDKKGKKLDVKNLTDYEPAKLPSEFNILNDLNNVKRLSSSNNVQEENTPMEETGTFIAREKTNKGESQRGGTKDAVRGVKRGTGGVGSSSGGNSGGGISGRSIASLGNSGESGLSLSGEDVGFLLDIPEVEVDKEMKKLVKINEVYVFDPITKALHFYGKSDDKKHELLETYEGNWVIENAKEFPELVIKRLKEEMYRVRDLNRIIDQATKAE